MSQFDEKVESKDEVKDIPTNDLIVYNDDVNSFEHVIMCFMGILKHSVEQAEQCATIIHYKGKCSVKKGSVEELLPYRTALSDMGLSADIN